MLRLRQSISNNHNTTYSEHIKHLLLEHATPTTVVHCDIANLLFSF